MDRAEVEADLAYEALVTPILFNVLEPVSGHLHFDLGAGEGRVMRAVKDRGVAVHGLDINPELAARSSDRGPAMVGEIPGLGFTSPGSCDGAYCVLVLEHIKDHVGFFWWIANNVRPGVCWP